MKKKIIWQILKMVGTLIGTVITYASAIAQVGGIKMLGLDWGWWVIIGFSIFAGVMFITLWQLNSEIKELTSDDTKQKRKERQLRIKNLEWEALSKGIDINDIEKD